MAELKDKVVIITGAGRGIGAATAKAFAGAGAAVVVSARTVGAAQAVADQIAAGGGQAAAVACDVTDYGSVAALVEEAGRRFGRVDVLVNNAGVIEPIGRVADTDPAAWAQAVEINLVGAYHAVRAALPAMLRGAGGTIVNLLSGAAFKAMEGWSAYGSSKAGLAMLTRSIAHEYGEQGIRAIGFAPGLVDTAMQGQIRTSGINPISRLPRDTLTPPEEPAGVIVWLCTRAADGYVGRVDVDIRDPALRQAAGLAALKS